MLLLTLAVCQTENFVGNKILHFLTKLLNQWMGIEGERVKKCDVLL